MVWSLSLLFMGLWRSVRPKKKPWVNSNGLSQSHVSWLAATLMSFVFVGQGQVTPADLYSLSLALVLSLSLSRPPSAPSVFRFSHFLVYSNSHWSSLSLSLSLSLFLSVFLSALWVSFEFLPFFFLWKHNNALCRGCDTRYYNICFFNLVKWTEITLFSTVQIMLEAKERGNWFCLRAKIIIIILPFLLNDWHEIKEMHRISLISCHLVALFPSFDLKQCSFVINDTDTSAKQICFVHCKLLLWWV